MGGRYYEAGHTYPGAQRDGGAHVFIRNYDNCRMFDFIDTHDIVSSVLPPSTYSSDFSLITTAPKYYCEDSFQGGGWLLVRRVQQGSTWHEASDRLQGTDVYGSYGTPVSETSFSIRWQGLGTTLLVTTGLQSL